MLDKSQIIQGHLKCSLVECFSSLFNIRHTLDEYVSELDGTIYMTYDWLRCWWRNYGFGRSLRLFIFSNKETIIGLLPFYIDAIPIFRQNYKVARLVGANIPPRCFDPPVSKDNTLFIANCVLKQLLGIDGCDVISFGPVSANHILKDVMAREAMNCDGLVRKMDNIFCGLNNVFYLPKNINNYFKSLSYNERKHRKQEKRIMKSIYNVNVELIKNHELIGNAFEEFVNAHTKQWSAEGKLGHFRSWPNALTFHKELIKIQGFLGRVRILRICKDNNPIANIYSYAFGKSYYMELSARSTDTRWNKISIGKFAIIAMLEEAIMEGMERVHAGIGKYEYKTRLGAKEESMSIIRIYSSRSGSASRTIIASLVNAAMKYGYHKIYYRRLSPKLPKKMRKAQSMEWLRRDY